MPVYSPQIIIKTINKWNLNFKKIQDASWLAEFVLDGLLATVSKHRTLHKRALKQRSQWENSHITMTCQKIDIQKKCKAPQW